MFPVSCITHIQLYYRFFAFCNLFFTRLHFVLLSWHNDVMSLCIHLRMQMTLRHKEITWWPIELLCICAAIGDAGILNQVLYRCKPTGKVNCCSDRARKVNTWVSLTVNVWTKWNRCDFRLKKCCCSKASCLSSATHLYAVFIRVLIQSMPMLRICVYARVIYINIYPCWTLLFKLVVA